MTTNESLGGFAGDPAAALTIAGSAGCCGNPAQTTNIALPNPGDTTGGTCCGTPAVAVAASDACCAPAAETDPAAEANPVVKADPVATGTGCCG
ncbi:hypothetical protein ACWDV4_17130 [Micromonospora sp. NPDC003197]